MLRAYRTERRWAQAGALAEQGAKRFPANAQWAVAGWMVRGDEAIASGDQFAALGAYLHAAQLVPDDPGIAREVSGILVRLVAPLGAGLQTQALDPGIEAAQAAALVTAAEVGDPALRFKKTDAAIARIDALLAEATAATPPDSGLVFRLRRDRVIALRDRGHWPATVEAVANPEGRQRHPPTPARGGGRCSRPLARGRGNAGECSPPTRLAARA